jgi:hypothetical protein
VLLSVGGFLVRALPRSAWAAAGMLLIASTACTVADPPSTGAPDPSSLGAPAPSSGYPPTVVAAEPTETSALETPVPTEPTAAERRPAHQKPRAAVPRPDHIVVVILENKHRSSVTSSGQAPYLNKLAAKGANMIHSYGVTPPQPAELSGAVLRVHPRSEDQRMPQVFSKGRQPGPSAP